MTGTIVAPSFETWSAPGNSFRIEYSQRVLEQIRETAVEGYHCVPHGGVETGGVLFGTLGENMVRIVAWRPVICEYARGPSFLLSEKDEAAFAETLQSWGGHAELAELEPMGWYRAHTRSEILLSDTDLTFYNRFFPRPWQVALIVRPASFAPTRAGFFFREADGSIRAENSYREFTLTPVATPKAAVREEAPPVLEAPPAPAEHSTLAAEDSPAPPAPPSPASKGTGGPWKWYAATVSVLLLAALGFWLLNAYHQGVTLSATDLRGELRIAWDGSARSIGDAKSGSVDIDDNGVRTQVNLTQADLRAGSLFYARQSGDVAVRLTVYVPGNPPVVGATRFLKPGESVPPPAPRVAAAKEPEPVPQPAASQAPEEPAPLPQAQPPQAQPPRAQPHEAPVKPVSVPIPATPARRVAQFRAPNKAARQSSTVIPNIAPPKIENMQAPAGFTSVLGPASGAAPAPSAPARPVAASGRIIWTGKLAKNSRLVVESNHASSGAISGVLPAVAVRVSAYPGDLTANGITFFTADPRYSQPLTEKAGAQNGWNPTTYTLDTKRAAGIKVVEQPGPQNGYKLVLESDVPKLSVVMIEWRATQ
jgi:proteasome lid subunit RPN8/RPN11